MTEPSPRQRFWVATLAALLVAGVTARLGWWQLDRAAQKTALRQAIDERGALPPLPLSALARGAEEAAAQHHRRVVLNGQWRPQHTVLLENRQMNGRPGFFVVTPLELADGRSVLVQRGWLPRDPADRSRAADPPLPAGEQVVHGRIAPPPARLYEFDTAARGRIRQNLDLDAHRRETGLALAPLSVLQEGPAGDGLLRQWPRPAHEVSKHHGYAFQWFGLSVLVIVLYVWFQLIRPRRRPQR